VLDFPSTPSLNQKYPTTPVAGIPQYSWDGEKWTTIGAQISNAAPATNLPLIDATPAVVGVATKYAREDHVHPTDTSRVAKAGDVMTGLLTLSADPTANLHAATKQYADAGAAGVASTAVKTVPQTLTPTERGQARRNIDVLKQNYIINGAMMISQEMGSTAGTINGYFPVDMFRIESVTAGAFSVSQVASPTPGGSPNRIRFTVTSPDISVNTNDFVAIAQRMEGRRVADLRFGSTAAKSIVVQFGCRLPGGTYGVSVINGAGTRGYVAEFSISAPEANTDVLKSVVIPGDQTGTWANDTSIGISLRWTLMCGSDYAAVAGAWAAGTVIGSPNQINFMGTNGAVFELFDVGVYEGTVAPPFQVPDYADELLQCLRYLYYTTGDPVGVANGGLISGGPLWFKVPMRISPTVGATFSVNTGNVGTFTASSISANGVGFYNISNNWTTNAIVSLATFKADARL
jgi:hypothetical protein